MGKTAPQSSIMYLEIDPYGDTLITIMGTDTQSSSPCGTGTVLPIDATLIKKIKEAAAPNLVFSA